MRRTMDQHVISAWHLRAFSRRVRRTPVLHVYDKASDSYGDVSVDQFLAEANAHSPGLEERLGRIEGPAATAALHLAKLARPLPPGLYAIGPGSRLLSQGPALTDAGVRHGMHLFVGAHEIPGLSERQRLSLAYYAGLMYQRAPKVEAALAEFARVYETVSQQTIDVVMPGARTGLVSDINSRRERMLRNARDIGAQLAGASWWVVRAGSAAFVLGDSPVATTISLGHDDAWRPILSDGMFAAAMPLGPTVALVIAPQRLMPVTGFDISDPEQIAAAINRLTWRSSDRFVVARDRTDLDSALPGADAKARRLTIPVDWDIQDTARQARVDAFRITARLRWEHSFGRWRRWERCRCLFGYPPWLAGGLDR